MVDGSLKKRRCHTKLKKGFVEATKPKNGFVGSTKLKKVSGFETNSKLFKRVLCIGTKLLKKISRCLRSLLDGFVGPYET